MRLRPENDNMTPKSAFSSISLAVLLGGSPAVAGVPALGKTLGAHAETIRQAGWTGGAPVGVVPVADVQNSPAPAARPQVVYSPGTKAKQKPSFSQLFSGYMDYLEEYGRVESGNTRVFNNLGSAFGFADTSDRVAATSGLSGRHGLMVRLTPDGRTAEIILVSIKDTAAGGSWVGFHLDRNGNILKSVKVVRNRLASASQQEFDREFQALKALMEADLVAGMFWLPYEDAGAFHPDVQRAQAQVPFAKLWGGMIGSLEKMPSTTTSPWFSHFARLFGIAPTSGKFISYNSDPEGWILLARLAADGRIETVLLVRVLKPGADYFIFQMDRNGSLVKAVSLMGSRSFYPTKKLTAAQFEGIQKRIYATYLRKAAARK
ncbi:MAG: hypothetical protein AUJ52_08665 [Elusimicrobia bacterium CG1_02_63_36]|nr:MAG: hypothetical protein AUJ52_08665 [Elusimicrobia bacterium CG1_02_63_36]PIP81814.1 MAG: hypothetical protein COR54_18025 [Elusimicrobia bacterium CG22_combo_CG10-13_8_21_14_all_63_91]PJA11490.1 MAG: hypothetical protein COX66_19575 [Elusimicrobia bacterium CG_4_10_14_0_2_um_filter_63_34]PJB24324.1 MAG: hypothetical protein CO113_14260 [Elusimicrobia bacterium CG_4_9_14_3_um_filter_62_55]